MTIFTAAIGAGSEYESYSGQEIEIIGQSPQDGPPYFYEDDTYRVRFSDGIEIDAFPDELDPIPPAGRSYPDVAGKGDR